MAERDKSKEPKWMREMPDHVADASARWIGLYFSSATKANDGIDDANNFGEVVSIALATGHAMFSFARRMAVGMRGLEGMVETSDKMMHEVLAGKTMEEIMERLDKKDPDAVEAADVFDAFTPGKVN